MKSSIEIIGLENCVGCFACDNVCPHENAMEIRIDSEGFYKQVLLADCIQCGKCAKACPVVSYKKENKLQIFYAAWSKDRETLDNSSSGGIFSEFAKYILSQNGIVYGAAWVDGKVKHISIDNIADLYKLQGSKYLQSNMENIYNDVKIKLKEGKKVLFSALPCQVAALYRTLKKDYENLFTIDLICHGVPSSKPFYKYISEISDTKFRWTNFRNKSQGWTNYRNYHNCDNLILNYHHREDKFFRGFLNDVYLGNPCYACKFKGLKNGDERVADITLGDFWGVPEEYFNDDLGVSVIGLNDKKSIQLFEKIKKNIKFHEVSANVALFNNSYYESPKKNVNRQLFFENIDKFGMKELEKKYFPLPKLYKRVKTKMLTTFKNVIKFILRKLGLFEQAKVFKKKLKNFKLLKKE